MILALVDDGDLVYGDVRYTLVLITQVENAGFHIHDVASKCGVGAARDVDLFAQECVE